MIKSLTLSHSLSRFVLSLPSLHLRHGCKPMMPPLFGTMEWQIPRKQRNRRRWGCGGRHRGYGRNRRWRWVARSLHPWRTQPPWSSASMHHLGEVALPQQLAHLVLVEEDVPLGHVGLLLLWRIRCCRRNSDCRGGASVSSGHGVQSLKLVWRKRKAMARVDMGSYQVK